MSQRNLENFEKMQQHFADLEYPAEGEVFTTDENEHFLI
jgi:hypothetical protein